MPPSEFSPSPALLAANARLLQLRAAAQGSVPSKECAATIEQSVAPAVSEAEWPTHLGWGSGPLTRALQQAVGVGEQTAVSPPQSAEFGEEEKITAVISHPSPPSPPAFPVKLYPDIGLAMLRQEQTAAGRLWLLLRGLDGVGRGWLRVVSMREQLTKKSKTTYLCTWRQMRNLLQAGQGVYWHYDGERVWLRSAARVALALGVGRLTGRPVALTLAALVSGIGRFRAELYAAFHSGRVKQPPRAQPYAAPIARETLTSLSGVGETTQRRYEQQLEQTKTAVSIQPNFAIGQPASPTTIEQKGWQQGNALFILTDFRGQQGPKGKQYVAWQLPNSYQGSHQLRPKGRQRRINRLLTRTASSQDLVMKGMPGNSRETIHAAQPNPKRDKRYYPTGKLAAQAFNRRRVDQCYWQQTKTRHQHFSIWQHLENRMR